MTVYLALSRFSQSVTAGPSAGTLWSLASGVPATAPPKRFDTGRSSRTVGMGRSNGPVAAGYRAAADQASSSFSVNCSPGAIFGVANGPSVRMYFSAPRTP